MLRAPLDWKYAELPPRQLAMQSCVLCSFVRCGTSKKKQKQKKKNLINSESQMSDLYFNYFKNIDENSLPLEQYKKRFDDTSGNELINLCTESTG